MQENFDIFHYKMLFLIVYNFAKIKLLELEFPCLTVSCFVHFKFKILKNKFYTLSYTCCHDNDREFVLWSRDLLCARTG